MATHQTRPPSTPCSHPNLPDIDIGEAVPSNGCGCFRLCGFGFDREGDYEHVQEEESWMAKKLKEVRGPKWKIDFIRKVMGIKKQSNRFEYDPVSYALNFDIGQDDRCSIAFSSRFAVPLSSRDL